MSRDPWFKFYAADWLAGTSGLTAAERGVYITLLAMMYDHGGPIERDDNRLCRRCGLTKSTFLRVLACLESLGKIVESNGRLFNFRAKSVLTERENKITTAKKAASASWEKRKENQRDKNADAYADAMQTHMRTRCVGDTSAYASQNQSQSTESRDSNESLDSLPFDFSNEKSHSPVAVEKRASRKPSSRRSKKPDESLAQTFLAEWNELADDLGLQRARALPDDRAKAIAARGRELVEVLDYPDAMTGFREVFAKIRASPFLRGETKAFRANIDFVTRASGMLAILEGKYDEKNNPGLESRHH